MEYAQENAKYFFRGLVLLLDFGSYVEGTGLPGPVLSEEIEILPEK